MFDVGFWELVILLGLGLMVLGPERLPKVAAKLGRWVGQARNMARHLSNQIRDEIEPFESGLDSVNKTLRKDFSALRPEPGAAAPPASEKAGSEKVESAPEQTPDDNGAQKNAPQKNNEPPA